MSDFGDDLASDIQQKLNTILMEAVRNFQLAQRKMLEEEERQRQQQAQQGNVPRSDEHEGRNEQKQPAETEPVDRTAERNVADAEKISPEAAAPDPLRETNADDLYAVPFSSEEARDAFAQVLDDNNISYVASSRPTLLIARGDMARINEGIVKAAPAVEEYIKSHDGMDIDTRSGVVETAGYDWKQDVADRVAEAREAAMRLAAEHDIPQNQQEKLFVSECSSRGVTIGRSADGDYLYRLAEPPEEAAGVNGRGILGKTLEKVFEPKLGKFSREFLFSPGAGLDEKSVAEFRDQQRALSPERDTPDIDLEKMDPHPSR